MPIYILIALFIFGVASQLIPQLPNDLYKKINKFIIFIPLPAITLYNIPKLDISKAVLLPILSAWITFFGAILFFMLIAKKANLTKATIACLILSCGLGNTSFVGFPILTQLYDASAIQYAIFVDQPGSFLIMSTLGVLVANYASTGNINIKIIFKKLFSFPPFICFIIALFLSKNTIPSNIDVYLKAIGSLMIPLAMLSLGMQFKLNFKTIPWKKFLIGVSYKLVIAPLVIYILYIFILQQDTFANRISVIECAMPPMITSSIIASEHGLDEDLAAVLPTLGILCSLPTLLVWKFILG
ncbi:MAG: AEC family transporter [Sphingobacteriales bacterium]|nr:MAG: AEC family transporter [Sphingobacteriales bacterium]